MITALGDAARGRLLLLVLLLAVSNFPARAATFFGTIVGGFFQGSSFDVYGTGFSMSGVSSPFWGGSRALRMRLPVWRREPIGSTMELIQKRRLEA